MPPKGEDHQLLDGATFGDSRRKMSSKYAAKLEHATVMSGRGDRESDRGEKRQPRRRGSGDKARAARGDDDDGGAPATLSFDPPKHEKVCNSFGCLSSFIHFGCMYFSAFCCCCWGRTISDILTFCFVYAQLLISFFSLNQCRHTMKGSSMRPRRVRGGVGTATTKSPGQVYL